MTTQSAASWEKWKDDIEARVRKLEAWHNFVLGASAGLLFLLGIFSHTLLKAAGLTP